MLLFASLTAALATTFDDGTEDAGLAALGPDHAAWGDVDQDGDPDLWDGATLWLNDDGQFVASGLSASGRGQFGDMDGDGDLDLYTFTGDATLYRNLGEGSWEQVADAFPPTGIVSSVGSALGDFDGDARIDVYIGAYEGNGYEPDVVCVGWGDGTFESWWVEPPSGPYTPYTKPGRGVTACDFDEDGDLDVYVSNYRLEQNTLWRNDGSGGFEDVARDVGAAGIDDGWDASFGHSIGSAWGDLDDDGDFDLFVGNFSHPDAYQDRPQFLENLGAEGGWQFADRSADAALAWQESFASPALGDFDNDGDLDLFYTTVYAGNYPVLLRNDGDWRFTDITGEAGLAGIGPTYQAAWADVDRDGDLDLVSGQRLWVNRGTSNHWLQVKLVGNGHEANTTALGAQARIALDGRVVTRQVEAGTGEGNANDAVLHFGLASATGPVDVAVRWPDGSEQVLTGIGVDQLVIVEQCGDADHDGAWDVACGGDDCDDQDGNVHPGADEVWYDGVDGDCAGDDDFDADRDGWAWGGGDCDDTDPEVHPGAAESWYDGVDADCGLDSDYDADGDGYDTEEYGGSDCDDTDAAVHPGSDEIWYDGTDGDCRGDSDFDADWDGYDAAEHGGADCDDTDTRIHPGAPEVTGNGIDEDCNGADRTAAPVGCDHGSGAVGAGWLCLWLLLGMRARKA